MRLAANADLGKFKFRWVSTHTLPGPLKVPSTAAPDIVCIVCFAATGMGKEDPVRYRVFIHRIFACPFHGHRISPPSLLLVFHDGHICDRSRLYREKSSLQLGVYAECTHGCTKSPEKGPLQARRLCQTVLVQCCQTSLHVWKKRNSSAELAWMRI